MELIFELLLFFVSIRKSPDSSLGVKQSRISSDALYYLLHSSFEGQLLWLSSEHSQGFNLRSDTEQTGSGTGTSPIGIMAAIQILCHCSSPSTDGYKICLKSDG